MQQFLVLTPILLGVTHAFDADHIAAVSALVASTNDPRRALRLALVWGIGHMIPLLAIAAVGLGLGIVMPAWMAAFVERSVGVMLLLLGGMALFGIHTRGIHIHAHRHDGVPHVHFHAHRSRPEHHHHHTHAAVLTGAVHGLAGSAAPMALIPLGAAHSAGEILLFVVIFGASVAAAMAAYAFGLGRFSVALGDRSRATLLVLRASAGIACMLLGGMWIVT